MTTELRNIITELGNIITELYYIITELRYISAYYAPVTEVTEVLWRCYGGYAGVTQVLRRCYGGYAGVTELFFFIMEVWRYLTEVRKTTRNFDV